VGERYGKQIKFRKASPGCTSWRCSTQLAMEKLNSESHRQASGRKGPRKTITFAPGHFAKAARSFSPKKTVWENAWRK
jgi:hypothetical protein